MKKILLAGSALVAALSIAPVANAADVTPVGYDWTGFYLGANAGVAWNNSSADGDFYFDGDRIKDVENRIDGDQAAFTGGALIGYNYQMDQIVLGVEADINYLGFSDDNKRSIEIDHGPFDAGFNSKSSLEADWFGTIRGRLGFAIDNVLLYGTGGLAYGHAEANSRVNVTVNGDTVDSWKGSADDTNWGWTLGGGMEYGISNWSLGLEYLYVDLGDGDWGDNHNNNQLAHDYEVNGNADYAFSVVRATAKVRF